MPDSETLYLLNPTVIRPGDIALIRTETELGERVRRQSGSAFDHALIYVGEMSCIESNGLGVWARNVQRIPIESEAHARVYRVRDASEDVVARAIDHARLAVGTEYGTREAYRSGSPTTEVAREPNRQYCTRLVGQAYAAAGVDLVANPDYCTPRDLETSERLEVVEEGIWEATPAEAEIAREEGSMLDRQAEVIAQMLEDARKVTGEDVQTISQMVDVVLEHPKLDGPVTEVVEQSGYLELWEMDVDKNPHYYDYEVFSAYRTPEHRDGLAQFLIGEPTRRRRYEEEADSCVRLLKRSPRRLLMTLLQLNLKLVTLSTEREAVGRAHLACPSGGITSS